MSHPQGAAHRERVVELYREYGPVVFRRCVRLLGDRERARDATQEIFVKLLREETLTGAGEEVLPWIYRVTTRHCLNLRRQRARQPLAAPPSAPELLEVVADGGAAYPERHLAHQVLERFDPTTQAVAIGVLVDGMEREEVAGALGISRRTVHRKLSRFLEAARRMLAGEEHS
jgi:RNA polymerase sigma-70 factor (ECF subfamily)